MPGTAQEASQACPECGGKMTFKTKPEELSYKGYVTRVLTEGWWGASCGEGILVAEALEGSERSFQELKAEVEGLLSPDEVAAIRQRLRLSQRKAGGLHGGGPRAF